jgi:Rps23 Pro-64 3,4-dihydroxylase Tpa1-like proline 4-hydroxylase
MTFVNIDNIKDAFSTFHDAKPFPYCVIDNFFTEEIAQQLVEDFPDASSDVFNGNYFNQIEIKKTCNVWDRFPATTYNTIQYLNSEEFIDILKPLVGKEKLYADHGLHGGGWHIHPPGGKLNVHLDYSIHPKMKKQRNYNLLVYLNPNWRSGWGGELGLWSDENNRPKDLVKVLEPKFNRAIIFDTTCNSWHGLEVPNSFPTGQDRKSIALYYLTDALDNTDARSRALFSPTKDQEGNREVMDLISRRSQITSGDVTSWSRS